MTRARPRAWTRRIAFTIGLALAAAVVLSLQVTNGSERLGANVTVAATGNGEVSVAHDGPFLTGGQLPRGMAASGGARVTNQTGAPLAVRVRATATSRDLDDLLEVRLVARGREFFRGSLGELRAWTRQEFRVPPRRAATLRVRTAVTHEGREHEGRSADLKLEFGSRPLGAVR